MRTLAASVLMCGLAACSTTSKRVRPDDMSAQQHRKEADREYAKADEHIFLHDPSARQPGPYPGPFSAGPDQPYRYAAPLYNPTDWHLREAEEHTAHALDHEAAARALEKFEEAECHDFAPEVRAACPLLGPVTRIEDTGGGVRLYFAPGVPIEAVAAHMRCHLAHARTRGYRQNADCPLYTRGVRIQAYPSAGVVEVLGEDKATIREVRRRAREEAVPGKEGVGKTL